MESSQELILPPDGPAVHPEIETKAGHFEASLLVRTKAKYIGRSGALNNERIQSEEAPHLVATIATNSPQEEKEAKETVGFLAQKKLHRVDRYGNVLFVDCTPVLQTAEVSQPFSGLRREIGRNTLTTLLETAKDYGIDLTGYEGIEQYYNFEQVLRIASGGTMDYAGGVSALIESLGAGKKGFLGRKDPIHVFPLYQFDSGLLPEASRATFDSGKLPAALRDGLARDAARFYKLATAIRTLESSSGFGHDGYGPYGRTIIVPEIMLYILDKTANGYSFPNVAAEVSGLMDGGKVEDMHRIRSSNAFMWEDMTSGKVNFPVGYTDFNSHNTFRSPGTAYSL